VLSGRVNHGWRRGCPGRAGGGDGDSWRIEEGKQVTGRGSAGREGSLSREGGAGEESSRLMSSSAVEKTGLAYAMEASGVQN